METIYTPRTACLGCNSSANCRHTQGTDYFHGRHIYSRGSSKFENSSCINAALDELQNSISHRDNVVDVRAQKITNTLRAREQILNKYAQWPDLFQIFTTEHVRLMNEQAKCEEERETL